MVLNGIFDPGEFHQFPIHVAHALELLSKFSSHIAYLSFKLAFFFYCALWQTSLPIGRDVGRDVSVTSLPTEGRHTGNWVPMITMSLSFLPYSLWSR